MLRALRERASTPSSVGLAWRQKGLLHSRRAPPKACCYRRCNCTVSDHDLCLGAPVHHREGGHAGDATLACRPLATALQATEALLTPAPAPGVLDLPVPHPPH